ncbi:hypothetical protein BEP19_02420 [Ammoniphilus oxalaticus]|uniref:DUF2922 domain-containing protein n=1 Tax=Ammoniphilus oxalaticus TaxID=66863 RepID=A0A419SNJ0_9BACL|nr:DUF2922 domain-containing protein [Ammoniphilus oxalaticus]RKD25812.1 hypothetical protein BEP19_02420 [Ammoniphilus oxalaticus]
MPREIDETVIALYFAKDDGTTVKFEIPAAREDVTDAEVKQQMEEVLEIGADLFGIVSIKGAAITHRTVTPFDVQEA